MTGFCLWKRRVSDLQRALLIPLSFQEAVSECTCSFYCSAHTHSPRHSKQNKRNTFLNKTRLVFLSTKCVCLLSPSCSVLVQCANVWSGISVQNVAYIWSYTSLFTFKIITVNADFCQKWTFYCWNLLLKWSKSWIVSAFLSTSVPVLDPKNPYRSGPLKDAVNNRVNRFSAPYKSLWRDRDVYSL